MLDLHTRTARQIEAAGGLRDRLATMMGDRTAPVGSAAWEARLEIDKIGTEAREIAAELGQPRLSATRRGEIEARQRELDQALTRENARLTAAAADVNGFIAAPRSLAQKLAEHSATGAIVRGLPDGISPATVPDAGAPASIDYGRLNADGQAVGIEATITQDILDTGSHADRSIRPPGFTSGADNHSRGHLLARMLGGSGDEPANLVTLFQRDTNSPVMSDFEQAIYDAVTAGEVVSYKVTSIHDGAGMPTALAISARGSDGFRLDITLINRDDT